MGYLHRFGVIGGRLSGLLALIPDRLSLALFRSCPSVGGVFGPCVYIPFAYILISGSRLEALLDIAVGHWFSVDHFGLYKLG